LERAHARIEELKLMNNKLNDQLIDEQQEKHKFHNNTIGIDRQCDTLVVIVHTIIYIYILITTNDGNNQIILFLIFKN